MSARRRASLAGLETQYGIQNKPDYGGSFGRRMSLASIGPRKYGRAFDSYVDSVKDNQAEVIVRHIPIVIEDDESESKVDRSEVILPAKFSWSSYNLTNNKSNPRLLNTLDDRSSLSSQSSDNSIDASRRKATDYEEARTRLSNSINRFNKTSENITMGRGLDEREVLETQGYRTPFGDITQAKDLSNKSKAPRKREVFLGTQYLVKTDTVGVKDCPLHGEGEQRVVNNFMGSKKNSGTLKKSSLIKTNNSSLGKVFQEKQRLANQNGRLKHNTIEPKQQTQDNIFVQTSKKNQFGRGPGQWSFRGTRNKNPENNNNMESKETNETQPSFQRRWSFRSPSLSANHSGSDTTLSFQAPTISSMSRSLSGPLKLPEYFKKKECLDNEQEEVPQMRKYSSQIDLTHNLSQTSKPTLTTLNPRMTPSSSTSSIPNKVSNEFENSSAYKPPCIGILKTPGKRKLSSNNRVEFLNNIREREIPGRFC